MPHPTRVFAIAITLLAVCFSSTPAVAEPKSPASVTLRGRITDPSGRAVRAVAVGVMLIQQRNRDQINAFAPQRFVIADSVEIGPDGSYDLSVTDDDLAAGFIGADRRVNARLVALEPKGGSTLHQVVEFNAPGRGKTLNVTQDAQMVDLGGRDDQRRTAGRVLSPADYCNPDFEQGYWVDVATSRNVDTSAGRVRTRAGTAMTLAMFEGRSRRTEAFIVAFGQTAQAGLTTAEDSSSDWAINFLPHTNVEVFAEVRYRYHQVRCVNVFGGEHRYPGVGEWYPAFATGGTSLKGRFGEPFTCQVRNRTTHTGSFKMNVTRSRTRTVTAGLSLRGATGRTSMGISGTLSVSSTTTNRVTYGGLLAPHQTFSLCGNDDVAIRAQYAAEI